MVQQPFRTYLGKPVRLPLKLFFESSSLEGGELCSLDEYVSRCTPEQDQIYYLMAPNRKMAEESPYYEAFKAHDIL